VGQLTVQVNGKPYLLGCEDGEEDRLRGLAAMLDEKVRSVASGAASLGDTRLMLMGALMLADEGEKLEARAAAAEAEAARLRALLDIADSRAVQLLEAAAKKIDRIAAG
jgi:cell division protein ZapA